MVDHPYHDQAKSRAGNAVAAAMDRARRSALKQALCGLDVVIALSPVPDWDLGDTETNAEDNAKDNGSIKLNLFGASGIMDADCDEAASNYLRDTARSALAQSRVVALRRRQVRARIRTGGPALPHGAGPFAHDLQELRAKIYAPDPEAEAAEMAPSIPLRLATHAISLSLVATALPVGAALMTYNILKGEDIKLTARMTTLCGLALIVLAGNPQFARLIGA